MAFSERLLARSPLQQTLTDVGLGCAPVGGLYSPVTDDAADATIATALALGIRFFDTAPLYGNGLSEQRLGRALRDVPRDSVTIATKVGYRILDDDGDDVAAGHIGSRAVVDLSPDGLRKSLESSLERLGVDRVDVLYLHDAVEAHDAVALAVPTLTRLRDEGLVRAIGAGMNSCEPLIRYVKDAGLDVVMVAGRYTLLDRTAEAELLPTAQEHGVEVIAAGIFNSGILAAPERGARFDYRDADPGVLERALTLQEHCRQAGVPLSAAAIQFPLRHPGVAGIVVGARSADEVRSLVADRQLTISKNLWSDLSD